MLEFFHTDHQTKVNLGRTLRVGFALIELMIVVAIIGILAAVAIPAFSRYMRSSRTTEAVMILRKIYDGEVAYYHRDTVNISGVRFDSQFVPAGPQPSLVPKSERMLGKWDTPDWVALNVSLDSPVRFSYEVVTSGTGINSVFSARARGDLDGDGTTSLFERVAKIEPSSGDILGGAGVRKVNPLE